jgi:3-hydroxybutyryl-CoA dehydrogenase
MAVVKKVAIIGCGTMGAGITQVVLEAGYVVKVREVEQSLLDEGLREVRKGLERAVEKGTLSNVKKEETVSRISGTLLVEDLKDSDLIIEAVFEEIQIKKELFKELDRIAPKETIFASNTSTLSITEMAAATTRPERVVGLHFFNPVYVMPLVEVIRTIATHSEVLEAVINFAKSLRKVPIVAKDSPGFIVNLLLTPYLIDAIHAVANGVASIQDIDTGMKLGCGYPMGPLMVADIIGLDVLVRGAHTMFEGHKDKRFAPPPLLVQMVRVGHIGEKLEKGFMIGPIQETRFRKHSSSKV